MLTAVLLACFGGRDRLLCANLPEDAILTASPADGQIATHAVGCMWHAPQLHWRRFGLDLIPELIDQHGRAHGRPSQILLSDPQSESVLLRDVRCVPEGRRK